MKRKITTAATLILLLLLATACVDIHDGDSSADDVICLDCDDWKIDESSDDQPAPGDTSQKEGENGGEAQGEVDQIALELQPCSPRAVESIPYAIPEIPDDVVVDECPLEKTTYTWSNGDQAVTWTWEANVLTREVWEDGVYRSSVEFEFDDHREEIREIRSHHDAWHAYSYPGASTEVMRTWVFDDRGRLVEYELERWEQQAGMSRRERHETMHQKWDQNGLTQRVEETVSDHVDEKSRIDWEYDEQGRLSEVLHFVDGQQVARSVWSYDGDHPASVERLIEGVAVERQSWQFDGDDLTARQFEVDARGIDGELDGFHASLVDGHDTYGARLSERFQWGYGEFANHWTDANAHLQVDAGDDCYELPVSPGHGYPDDEASYHLGWSDTAEHISGIGFRYGYNGYGYGYGETSWYGHLGIGSAWPSIDGWMLQMRSEMEYDEAGRMVGERLFFDTVDEEEIAVQRHRQFVGGGLVRDHIDLESQDDRATAELRFLRDEHGNLLTRERLRDDQLVSRQQWDYDDGQNAISLEIAIERVEPWADGYTYGPIPNMSPAELLQEVDATTVHTITYLRSFDDAGRQTYYGEIPVQQSGGEHHEFTEYGSHGPLESVSEFHNAESITVNRTLWEYDDRGNVVGKITDRGDDGQIDVEKSYVYDEQGRLVEEFEDYGFQFSKRTYHYACGG